MAEIKEVFISYHEKSAGEYVAKLADRLEGAGISCWYAKRDLPSGESFADCIPQQIKNCKVFLLILNEGTNHSKHIRNEMTLAFRRLNNEEEITILPYRVEKCVFADWLDYYLAQIQIQSSETMDDSALVTEVAHKLKREPMKNGICGDFLKWTVQDGTLSIFAEDHMWLPANECEMSDFHFQENPERANAPWWDEHEKIKKIVVQDGVSSVGEYAFFACHSATSVTLPDSIARIGAFAFNSCSQLTDVAIPPSVANIQFGTFVSCNALTNVIIPDSVSSIDDLAFGFCASLKDIVIPDSVTRIGFAAFMGCSNLVGVSVPSSVISIEDSAFARCPNLKRISVSANAEIADNAFEPTTEVIRRPR